MAALGSVSVLEKITVDATTVLPEEMLLITTDEGDTPAASAS